MKNDFCFTQTAIWFLQYSVLGGNQEIENGITMTS